MAAVHASGLIDSGMDGSHRQGICDLKVIPSPVTGELPWLEIL